MPPTLRILYLEDNAADREAVQHCVTKRSGLTCEFTLVSDSAGYEAALARGGFDLILADYHLPGYDGMTALSAAHQQHPEIPFIFVSGLIGEERAIESLKQGATDYILKDRLERLPAAIRRALSEAEEHRQRVRLEAELAQARKMETIGQFAGAMAHDFNNLLTVILGQVSFILDEEPLTPYAAEALKQVYTAADHAARLVRQWLHFSRKHPPLREAINLNTVVEETADLLRPLLGAPVSLTIEPFFPAPWILADRDMIVQVLLNLAANARDAMPGGGRLVIQTGLRHYTPEDAARNPSARPGDFVCLSVRDTGPGIPPDVAPHIFDPFFTTKPEGHGTGLGLAIVMDIIKRHDGWIEVEGPPGAGTTFTLLFPPAPPAADKAPSTPPSLADDTGRETILLVEDDPKVREFAVTVLQRCGYSILQAKSGDQALAVWHRHASKIRLLLTDLVLPGELSGQDLTTRLLSEKPDLKVVIASGSLGLAANAASTLPPSVHILSKPYLPKMLAHAVRTALDGQHTP